MKSRRLLTLIFLILTLVKAYDTSKEAEEALAAKNNELFTGQDSLNVVNLALKDLETEEADLKKDKESLESQLATLIENEKQYQQRKEELQENLPNIEESIKAAEYRALIYEQSLIVQNAELISSPSVLELIMKRNPDFEKETEITKVKKYKDELKILSDSLTKASKDLIKAKSDRSKKQEEKKNLEDKVKVLILQRDQEEDKTKKDEIQKEIDTLEISIGKLATEIKNLESNIPNLETNKLTKQTNFKKHLEEFYWYDLMEEMMYIVVKSNYKYLNKLIKDTYSLQEAERKAKENMKIPFEKLQDINTKIQFYNVALRRKIDHENAKTNLTTLNEQLALIEKEEKESSGLVTKASRNYSAARSKLEDLITYVKDEEVEEEGFDEIKLEEVNRAVSKVYARIIWLEYETSSALQFKLNKLDAEQEIDLSEKLIELLNSLKSDLDTPKSNVEASLITNNRSINMKSIEIKGIEQAINIIQTDIANIKVEIKTLKEKEEKARKAHEEEEIEKARKKQEDEDSSSRTRTIIIVVVIALVIVGAAGGLYCYRRKASRTTGFNDRNAEELI